MIRRRIGIGREVRGGGLSGYMDGNQMDGEGGDGGRGLRVIKWILC